MIACRIALVGGYGHGNLGDDVLMLCAVSVLSRRIPKRDITIVVREPTNGYCYVRKLVPECDVVSVASGETIRCDYVIYGGGTMFRAFPTVKKGLLKKANKALSVATTRPGQLIKRTIATVDRPSVYPRIRADHSFALGVGLGPFWNGERSIHEAQDALGRCEYISVRDRFSERLCRDWGIRNVMRRADLSFWRQLWSDESKNVPTHSGRLKRIAIIVREWKHTDIGDSYRVPLQEAVGELRKAGLDVTYVFFQNEPSWGRMLSSQGDEPLAYSPAADTVSGFVDRLGQFDLIITSRAHGAILGATLGIPSICIEIEPKLKYACDSLGRGSRLWSPPFDAKRLVASVREMSSDFNAHQEHIWKAARINRTLAEMCVSEFLEILDFA